MRLPVIAIAGVALGSCSTAESAAVDVCESALMTEIRSPSTYSRVNTYTPEPANGFREVAITYDAANAFGTPVRGSKVCVFRDNKDGLPSRSELEIDALTAQTEAAARVREGKSVYRNVGGVTIGECCVPDAKLPPPNPAP